MFGAKSWSLRATSVWCLSVLPCNVRWVGPTVGLLAPTRHPSPEQLMVPELQVEAAERDSAYDECTSTGEKFMALAESGSEPSGYLLWVLSEHAVRAGDDTWRPTLANPVGFAAELIGREVALTESDFYKHAQLGRPEESGVPTTSLHIRPHRPFSCISV